MLLSEFDLPIDPIQENWETPKLHRSEDNFVWRRRLKVWHIRPNMQKHAREVIRHFNVLSLRKNNIRF
jgi:hypothetical protein